jgi:hypothetical protein
MNRIREVASTNEKPCFSNRILNLHNDFSVKVGREVGSGSGVFNDFNRNEMMDIFLLNHFKLFVDEIQYINKIKLFIIFFYKFGPTKFNPNL